MKSEEMPDKFDRALGQLHGLPDSLMTRPSTVRIVNVLGVGGSALYIVQTHRQQTRDDRGRVVRSDDTVFLETVDEAGSLRLVLPPGVVDAIVRQRDSFTGKVRRAAATRVAEARKARGERPAFLKGKR
jgi:hypothetical protein